ncbi:MAG: BON domain-containing protein [Leptolyngbyaceae cyanobacterium SM1_1_3]|nr:BON domain-containing protein [Leptolyngbyaceae cyanobacterium SM1_1_3]NJN01915.1 BON domain-containing protein [Leptolyngbyaceae cyanobacterium RM1_1_2]NJO10895.1 BON domain-containing protein [Leptolyngbyaceae cyanobacterium SL_1_1]
MGVYEAAYMSGQTAIGGCAVASLVPTSACSWYRTIPPERIGLCGEYDHQGLAKRVQRHFCHKFETEAAGMSVRQRGRIVILQGEAASEEVLKRLVQAAMQTEGADAVELHGVTIQAHK